MLESLRSTVTEADVVILRQIEDAEAHGADPPESFVDNLVRLARVGYIEGDAARVIRLTSRGRSFLSAGRTLSS